MNRFAWKHEFFPVAQRFAPLTALVDAQGSLTFAELFDRAAGIAAKLIADGIGPGDMVASLMPNGRDAVAVHYAVSMTGACEAPINTALSAEEVAHCADLVGASLFVTVPALADRAGGLPVIDPSGIAPARLMDLPAVAVSPDDWCRVAFTSGTTGKPKGIAHSHGGRWRANILLRATLPLAATPGRNVLLMTPYSHGASLMAQAFHDTGAAVTLLRGVDEPRVRAALEDRMVDQIFASPTVLVKLCEIFAGRVFDHIRAIYTGTAPLPREVYQAARAIFGPVVRITYGKSETYNPITVLTPEETDRWYDDPRSAVTACVGWPASGVEIMLGDPDEGEEGPPADGPVPRPILLRTQHMLAAEIGPKGVEVRPPEALHRTGDLGYLDELGRLHLVGREADVIKTGGYRVTPDEIEGALRGAMPGGELIVLSLPSSYWGEVITAVAAGAPDGWREALVGAMGRLSKHKRPRLFAQVDAIARNGLGKVVRGRTREAVLARYDFIDGRYPDLRLRG
ncbi:class I adenylate-forming enzyme family protein [Acuticoccus sp.]|uniref:class I adenylate-forming enzyme family protein n=1 Tax=Acuticoccus sp. TaxID=1904378 RepID=UPI003B52CED3